MQTLQKSMLLTPLLPSAGPTGGLGDAWPAPTMSLTIWSFCIALRAMMAVTVSARSGWACGRDRGSKKVNLHQNVFKSGPPYPAPQSASKRTTMGLLHLSNILF